MKSSLSSWIAVAVTIIIMTVLCISMKSVHSFEVTYADLEIIDASCRPEDTCNRARTITFNIYRCDCDPYCAVYDTCCVDSMFKSKTNSLRHKINVKCLSTYHNPDIQVLMVDSCKNDKDYDSLCYSNPEEANDPFLTVPVTSEVSRITYKNYFCAVCNEEIDSEHFRPWDIEISVNGTILKNISELQFKFNKRIKSWTVHDGKDNEASYDTTAIDLNLYTKNFFLPKYCEKSLISNCARNWRDERVAFKCRDYMAIVVNSQNVTYRNVHCALCNFENLGNLECAKGKYPKRYGPPLPLKPAFYPGRDIALLDVFSLEGRRRRCGRNMMYDKYADKCRCNSRIFKKESGRCVQKV